MQGERQLCLRCLNSLSKTHFSILDENAMERKLAGRFPFEHATALYYFRRGGTVQQLIHAIKFHGNSELCLKMGRKLGLALLRSGHFDDVDILVPVPLHWRRKLQRGYNQSELLCRGIAEVFPRPINRRAMVRHRNTKKQSMQESSNRSMNVEGAFRVNRPKELEGRHVLLVDDVFTTGATVGSCADALAEVAGIRISVATLSFVG